MNRTPAAFRSYNQFVVWREFPNPEPGKKPIKSPINPAVSLDEKADPHDRANWLTVDQAVLYADTFPDVHIGFVFTAEDPFFFFDIDNALGLDGEWSDLAKSLYAVFTGCYFEISHSGNGFHLLGTITRDIEHACKNTPTGLEFYTDKRFVALTGTQAAGCASMVADQQVQWLVDSYFTPQPTLAPEEWTTEPDPNWRGLEDDEELIKKALESKSAGAIFGGKATFADLWAGKTEFHGGDDSAADAALCSHLAFWVGRNCERIDRLFRLSKLMRAKWDRKTAGSTYGRITIQKAVALCNKVYGEGATVNVQLGATRDGFQLLTVDRQVEYFKDCVFECSSGRIFTPGYGLVDQKSFKAIYGGYIFLLGNDHDSKTTTDAWKAFTESQGYNFPVVHGTVFRPTEPPRAVIYHESRSFVNTWLPVEVPCGQGDITPFTDLLTRLLPEQSDRDILLAYMAACVQYPGYKFQWCPLLQGTQGNGKTFLAESVAHAVGITYSHSPNTKDIDNKFNDWLKERLFIVVEEVCLSDRKDVMEVLKPMLTNTRLEVQGKGSKKEMIDNFANFFMCSNYKNAVKKTKDDRRYAVFFTAQQSFEDIARDGMGGEYFPSLWDWARADGYAAIAYFLKNYAIPVELNPAGSSHRAPVTSATGEAIVESLTLREQEILNAADEGVDGFRGGWVSTVKLARLMKEKGLRLGPANVKEILTDLGYTPHPALPNGRVNNPMVTEDGKKPRLYVKKGHVSCNIARARDVVDAYIKAQARTPTMADMVFGTASS